MMKFIISLLLLGLSAVGYAQPAIPKSLRPYKLSIPQAKTDSAIIVKLKQDNMPCLKPRTNNIARIPNAHKYPVVKTMPVKGDTTIFKAPIINH